MGKKACVILGLLVFFLLNREIYARGVSAGTLITNKARVEYDSYVFSNSISTQVRAVYGMSTFSGATNGFTYPGGTYLFHYSITNYGNTNINLIVVLNNFLTSSSNSVTNWKAYIIGFNTSRTVKGTNSQSRAFTNVIPEGSSYPYDLYIQTSIQSKPFHRGMLPLVSQVTSSGLRILYFGDNGIQYGGTNYGVLFPSVTIYAPFIALRKNLSVSNMPAYLARGGNPAIPVPDTYVTYTNFYDNDGNARATNLIIRDRIPYHTDFIVGSVNTSSIHTNGNVTVQYRDRSGASYTPSGPAGSADAAVREIILFFSGSPVGVHTANSGTDSFGTADGQPMDSDAGYFFYKVRVHRRE
ncbi:MAG: hypothetical protein PHF84_12310 [bacterium]|nr:hypothetical protein [bacterium]